MKKILLFIFIPICGFAQRDSLKGMRVSLWFTGDTMHVVGQNISHIRFYKTKSGGIYGYIYPVTDSTYNKIDTSLNTKK